MTGGPDLVESIVPPPSPRSPRPARRRFAFVSLAGLMAVLGVAAAAYYGLRSADDVVGRHDPVRHGRRWR